MSGMWETFETAVIYIYLYRHFVHTNICVCVNIHSLLTVYIVFEEKKIVNNERMCIFEKIMNLLMYIYN